MKRGGDGFNGFVGYGNGGTNTFFDADADNLGKTNSGYNNSGATGKTTEEMKTLATFTDAGWDFEGESTNGTADIWDMDLSGSINDGYPYLSWEDGEDVSLPVTLSFFNAKVVKGTVLLEWETSAEIENQGFNLYKVEAEVEVENLVASFANVDALKGQGSTTETTKYAFTDKNVEPGKVYVYTLTDVDYAGNETEQEKVEVEVKPCEMSEAYFTGEVEGAIVADSYALDPVYPNPFNAILTIPFILAEPMKVSIHLYTLTGRHVMTAVNHEFGVGSYTFTINADDLSSGIYFVHTTFNSLSHIQKVVLAK